MKIKTGPRKASFEIEDADEGFVIGLILQCQRRYLLEELQVGDKLIADIKGRIYMIPANGQKFFVGEGGFSCRNETFEEFGERIKVESSEWELSPGGQEIINIDTDHKIIFRHIFEALAEGILEGLNDPAVLNFSGGVATVPLYKIWQPGDKNFPYQLNNDGNIILAVKRASTEKRKIWETFEWADNEYT